MTFTLKNLVILSLGAAATCGGYPSPPVAPAPATPEATVEQFMAAVNAADLGRMAELWGTENGPSTVTGRNSPQTRQRQLTIMQRILQSDEHHIVGTDSAGALPNQRIVNVELVKGSRRATVPFTMVAARVGGWLILAIALEAALPPAPPPAQRPGP